MRSAAILLLTATPAHADNALQARVETEAGRTWLDLDPVLPAQLEGLVVSERRQRRDVIALDPHTAITLSLDEWANKDRAAGYHDLRGQGWRAAARVTRHLGWGVRLDLHAALGDVDSPIGRGRYAEAGASLLRTLRLSRWMTAYAGLTIGYRQWLGDGPPPLGEAKTTTQAMLVIGTSFR